MQPEKETSSKMTEKIMVTVPETFTLFPLCTAFERRTAIPPIMVRRERRIMIVFEIVSHVLLTHLLDSIFTIPKCNYSFNFFFVFIGN
jgi:hypothetical protein